MVDLWVYFVSELGFGVVVWLAYLVTCLLGPNLSLGLCCFDVVLVGCSLLLDSNDGLFNCL